MYPLRTPCGRRGARAVRAQYEARIALMAPLAAVADVCERTIDGPGGPLRLRIYKPLGTCPFPLLVFFHGSGFVPCSLDTHDGMCRNLCAGAACASCRSITGWPPSTNFPPESEDCLALSAGRRPKPPNSAPTQRASRATAPAATWPRLPQDRLVDVPEHGMERRRRVPSVVFLSM